MGLPAVGTTVVALGWPVGASVGISVGEPVGWLVGVTVGVSVGEPVG